METAVKEVKFVRLLFLVVFLTACSERESNGRQGPGRTVLDPAIGVEPAEEIQKDAPVLEFEKKQIDLGVVELSDEPLDVRLALRNSGGGVLQIHELRPSCGCIAGTTDRSAVGAGESLQLKLELEADRRGKQVATIAVVSNCSINPESVIGISWDVRSKAVLVPADLLGKEVDAGTNDQFSLMIESCEVAPEVLRADLSVDRTIAGLHTELTRNSPVEYELKIRAEADVDAHTLYGQIHFRLDGSEVPIASVPLSIAINPQLSVVPDTLWLHSNDKGEYRGQLLLRTTFDYSESDVVINAVDSKNAIREYQVLKRDDRYAIVDLLFDQPELSQEAGVEISIGTKRRRITVMSDSDGDG